MPHLYLWRKQYASSIKRNIYQEIKIKFLTKLKIFCFILCSVCTHSHSYLILIIIFRWFYLYICIMGVLWTVTQTHRRFQIVRTNGKCCAKKKKIIRRMKQNVNMESFLYSSMCSTCVMLLLLLLLLSFFIYTQIVCKTPSFFFYLTWNLKWSLGFSLQDCISKFLIQSSWSRAIALRCPEKNIRKSRQWPFFEVFTLFDAKSIG